MSFKKVFLLGLSSGLLATIACVVYTQMYYSTLVNFSEQMGFLKMLSNCLFPSIGACFFYYIIHYVIKKEVISDFLFNLIYVMTSVGMVFYILKMNDPTFTNEDASLFLDYYKGFIMPMLFFPVLAWFILTPLFFRKK